MRKKRVSMLALLLAVALAGCGGGAMGSQQGAPQEEGQAARGSAGEETTYEWKFALDETQGSNQDIYAQIFKKIVEEKSEGRVKLQIYYLGQLGDGSNQGELIQNGAIHLGFMAAGAAGTMVPESNIFSLHYIFPSDLDRAKQFLAESQVINHQIAAAYEAKNMKVIDWMDEGFMQWTANKPIHTPEDFEGVKMRVMAAPIITSTYENYGASPVTIPFSELYGALQLKMADGQTNPVEIIEQMKFYEVQNHLTIANSDLYVASLIFNKPLWESLPEDIKDMLAEAVEETRPLYDVEQKEMMDAALEKLSNEGMEITYVDEDAIARFRELAREAKGRFVEVGGPDAEALYDEFMEEAKLYY